MEEVKPTKGKSKAKTITLWAIGLVTLWALLTGGFILLMNPNRSEKFHKQLDALSVSFPLYYPEKLPKGIEISPESVNDTSQFVSFGLLKDGKEITVTQQARPPFMEEVNKIKDVSSPLGKSYIAKLEKYNAGFLITDKTLLTVTSVASVDDDTLAAILQSLVVL